MQLKDIYFKCPYGRVPEKYVKFLYKLLSQREPHQNISHKAMPTYEAHTNFVNGRPYSKWFVIIVDDLLVGAIYLSKEFEIGLFIDKDTRGTGIGAKALKKFLKHTEARPLYANIAPNNIGSKRFFERHGFMFQKRLVQPNSVGVVSPIQDVYMLSASYVAEDSLLHQAY